ncbi:AraC family transcriptional regulator, partial [Vibrio nigripulchritudo ATCC 27043]
DLALHVMARYANFELAKQVADFCLLDFKGRMQAYYQRFIPDLTHGDVVVLKAQQFCDANFSEDIAVADIAQHCHLSERSLLRRFKSATGYTPKQYIIQLRVERAKQLIELENITIEAAGAAVGYIDVSNFTKLFKKTTGITPAEFKQRVG